MHNNGTKNMDIVKDHFAESMETVNVLKQNVLDLRDTIQTMEKTMTLQDGIIA